MKTPSPKNSDSEESDGTYTLTVTRKRQSGPVVAEEPYLNGTCVLKDGEPEDGLGYVDVYDDFKIDLTYAAGSFGCDHAGPQTQVCSINSGGFVTWLENGQRKHIRAIGGPIGVTLIRETGVRCD